MFNREADRVLMPEMDPDGFLIDTRKWTKEVAEILAKSDMPQGLTEDHWKVIDYLRQYFLEWESAPPVRMLARETGLSLRDLKHLFPDGLRKYACKYAGLPCGAVTRYP
jgi:TusE/DsrC/DsvC family sulfur relay protein